MLILRAKIQRDGVPEEFLTKKEKPSMSRNLQGLGEALKKLQHAAEQDAESLLAKIAEVDARRQAAVKAAQDKIEATVVAGIQEVEQFVTELEGNGGPPLDGSQKPQQG